MAFRTGMRVACIDPEFDETPGAPQYGDVATVTNVYVCPNGNLMLELAEYPKPEDDDCYAGWIARFFRPVRETSIECFKQYLAPTPVEGEMA